MRMSGSAVELSASDLSGSLSCTHLTALDLAVAKGLREPSTWVAPSVIALRERGLDHERRYVKQLISDGLSVEDLSDHTNDDVLPLLSRRCEEVSMSSFSRPFVM